MSDDEVLLAALERLQWLREEYGEFDNRGGYTAEAKAQALAEELNAREREWEASLR